MNFNEQSKKAFNKKTANAFQEKFHRDEAVELSQLQGKRRYFKSDDERDKYVMGTQHFRDSMDQAALSKDGAAFFNDNVTGENEMIVFGTRSKGDWAKNALDGVTYGVQNVFEHGVGDWARE